MFAFVTAPDGTDHDGSPEVLLATSKSADLVGCTDLGTGIRVAVDLAQPQQWRSISVARWERADHLLLNALIGPDVWESLAQLRDDLRSSERSRGETTVSLDLAPARPWLRVAVVDALDRWLQLPLDQALVDAEHGIALGRAAQTLSPGTSRERLLGEALVMVRLSAKGLANYLSGLTESPSPLPSELVARLEEIVNGYAALRREVVDGPDTDLDDVAEAWIMLTTELPIAARSTSHDAGQPDRPQLRDDPVTDDPPLASLVDPRQLRARVVDIDPAASEIRMETTRLGDAPAVLVTVPAFGPHLPPATIADRLLVRLVDSSSAEVQGVTLLTLASSRDAGAERGVMAPVFTGVVPLHGAAPEDLRADVFDAGSDVPPAPADTDSDLLRVRRAAFVLREWRLAAAEARLTGDIEMRNRRLTRLIDAVTPAIPHSNQPIFYGGPTLTELTTLIKPSAQTSPQVRAKQGWVTTTEGAGDFLLAELAAVHGAR